MYEYFVYMIGISLVFLALLPPCPNSPNCVSSQAKESSHYVAPLEYSGRSEDAMRRLRYLLLSMPRTKCLEENASYLHVTFRSYFFGFIDDVECLLDKESKRIHIRSASRSGYYDFGVNKRRVEEIRRLFSLK